MENIKELQDKIRNKFWKKEKSDDYWHYMCPAIAIDRKRNLALVIEELQYDIDSNSRTINIQNTITLYDFKRDKILRSWIETQKTGPGSDQETYKYKQFTPIFENKKLYLIEKNNTHSCRTMEILETLENKKCF